MKMKEKSSFFLSSFFRLLCVLFPRFIPTSPKYLASWIEHQKLCFADIKYMGPLRVTVPPIVGSVGTARTMPSLCLFQPHTGMFAAVDMMVQILLKPVQILFKPILFFSYIHVLAW
ncbi:MAG: hypothetical protein LGB78_00555 [Sulfurovum sp.]|nr:hypothetical protein [Sulfurovum sp.]